MQHQFCTCCINTKVKYFIWNGGVLNVAEYQQEWGCRLLRSCNIHQFYLQGVWWTWRWIISFTRSFCKKQLSRYISRFMWTKSRARSWYKLWRKTGYDVLYHTLMYVHAIHRTAVPIYHILQPSSIGMKQNKIKIFFLSHVITILVAMSWFCIWALKSILQRDRNQQDWVSTDWSCDSRFEFLLRIVWPQLQP